MSARVAVRAASIIARPVVRSSVAFRPVAARVPLRTYTTRRTHSRQQYQQQSARRGWTAAGAAIGAGLVVASTLAYAAGEEKKAPAAGAPAAAAAAGPVDYAAVRKAIVDILDVEGYDDGSRGPVFVRLAWHAAGTYDKVSKTGGSDGATMRFPAESAHGANAGLHIARDALEVVKKQFPGISYADLWTLAGSVAIEEMGGPSIPWRAGRTDAAGPSSPVPDGRLPDAAQGQQHVRDIFYRMGFNDQEIVALIGAHALGRCHEDRSGFKGPWTRAPTTFSNEFFRVLLEEKWTENTTYKKAKQFQDKSGDLMMLPADLSLIADPEFKKWVVAYAKDEALFFRDFSAAWTKLIELGVRNLAAAPALPQKAAAAPPAPPKPAAAAVAAAPAPAAAAAPAPKPAAAPAPAPAAAAAAAPAKAAEPKKEEVSWWKKLFGGK